MSSARLERGLTGEILLMIVANVRTTHILVLHTSNPLAQLLPLDAGDIAEHSGRSEERRVGKEC